MIFNKIKLEDAFLINIEEIKDDRGSFARVYSQDIFKEFGINKPIVQINNSWNNTRATLRGIHYQLKPKSEGKLIRCITGKIWDLIIDLRVKSKTFGQWFGVELSAQNKLMLFAPEGFGHGYISLEDNSEIVYAVTEFYSPDHERIIRWDDPKFGIKWPLRPNLISEKDETAPDFDYAYHLESNEIKQN